jgi:hypothetical protein
MSLSALSNAVRTLQELAADTGATMRIDADTQGNLTITFHVPSQTASRPASRRHRAGGTTVARTVREMLAAAPETSFSAADICTEIEQHHQGLLAAYAGDARKLDSSVRQVLFREAQRGTMDRPAVGRYQSVVTSSG